jgi:hypothetical protein
MADKKLDLVIVVNGHPTTVDVEPNALLRSVIPKALEQTGNQGQPPENWELRDANGVVLDIAKKVRDFGFAIGTKLFLNLKAGVGGGQAATVPQFVDPAVSRTKFDDELADVNALAHEYRQRGWFLLEADFPRVVVLLATPRLTPAAVICAVAFDYSNYDAVPPSVKLVHPFTLEPYQAKDLPTSLNKSLPAQTVALPGGGPANLQLMGAQPLMQFHSPEEVPFLCLAGVREYHDHPGHSGDLWELHRAAGAGRLVRLLEIIDRYGVEPINGYSVNLVPQVGLQFGPPPQ